MWFNFWENGEIEPIAGTLGARLRPTSCHVMLCPVLKPPQVVSVGMQGFLDLVAETGIRRTIARQRVSIVEATA